MKKLLSLLLMLALLLTAAIAVGATETASEPDFSYSLTLNKSIAINFKVARADIADGFTSIAFYKGDTLVKTVTELPEGDSEKVVFSFDDLTPHEMAAEIKAVLTVNGQEYTKTASVLSYCNAVLAGDYDNSLKTLVVDLLNYGAETQTYVGGYSALVNAELGENASFATTADPIVDNITAQGDDVEGESVTWKGVGLNLKDSVTVRFRFSADSTENLKLVISGAVSGEITEFEAAESYDGQYYAYFSGLNPAQMRDSITVQAFRGDTPVSKTLTYSIESYAAQVAENSETYADELPLTKAMMRYGDSVAYWVMLQGLDTTVATDLPYVGSTVHDGDDIEFVITIQNNGAKAVSGLPVTQAVGNATVVSAENGEFSDSTAAWTVDIPVGGEVALTFKVNANGTIGQSVTADCTVGVDEVNSADLRIGSSFSDIQLDVLNGLTEEQVSSLKGELSAANYLRKVYTDVLGFTGDASKALPGYSSFAKESDDSLFFVMSGDTYAIKEDLSGLSATNQKTWNSLVYYSGDLFKAENNGRYISAGSFSLAALEPGDYIMGYVDKTDGYDYDTFHAIYLGADTGGNYLFAQYQTSTVASWTDSAFADFMGSWHNVYIMRPALSYDVYNAGVDVEVANGLNAFNSVETGSTVTYTVRITNKLSVDITGLAVSAATNYDTCAPDTAAWSIDIPAGGTESVTYTVLVNEKARSTVNSVTTYIKYLKNTVTVGGVEYTISNRISYGINDTKEANLLSNEAVVTAIGDVRTIYTDTFGIASADSKIVSIGTMFTTSTSSDTRPFIYNSSNEYQRNIGELTDTGNKNNSYVVLWGGSKTIGNGDPQHMAQSNLNFSYLQPGDYFCYKSSSSSTNAYALYLGKTVEDGVDTYWFANSSGAKVGYTADQVSSVIPEDVTHFVLIRICNYWDLSE